MPTNSKTQLKTIVDFARRKGFVFPSSEIYGGFAATYDFGPLGILLKKNIEQAWRYWNVTSRTDMVEIEGAIFMHPKVWEASGHIGGFSDLLVEDTVTKKRYRADHLVEDAKVVWPLEEVQNGEFKMENNLLQIDNNMEQRVLIVNLDYYGNLVLKTIVGKDSETSNFGVWDLLPNYEDFKNSVNTIGYLKTKNKVYILATPKPNTRPYEQTSGGIGRTINEYYKNDKFEDHEVINFLVESLKNINLLTNAGPLSAEEIDKIITYYNLKSPDGNTLSGAKQFNLMVKTHLGPVEDETSVVYLKGESCANIYLDWKAVQETTRRKLPFGIAQIGKAFRNEITVKQFMFRTREFEQMDVEYFVKPGTEDKHYAYFKQNRWDFYTQALNINSENMRFRQHDKDELVFYAKEAWDVEYNFGENGFKELEGIHNRTDYDTKQHSKFSGQDLTYFDPEDNSRYLPYIVEASAGFNRMFLATMFEFYTEQEVSSEKEEKEIRVVLKFPYNLAPFKLAILPLMKKDGLGEYAFELYAKLRKLGISADYDESGSIGKRYRRQDENGTPWCLCVDYETVQEGELKNTVTLRHRDTMEQKRVSISDLEAFITKF